MISNINKGPCETSLIFLYTCASVACIFTTVLTLLKKNSNTYVSNTYVYKHTNFSTKLNTTFQSEQKNSEMDLLRQK